MYANQKSPYLKTSYDVKQEQQQALRRAAICAALGLNSSATDQDIEKSTFACYEKLGISTEIHNPIKKSLFATKVKDAIHPAFLQKARLESNNRDGFNELATAWGKLVKLYLVDAKSTEFLLENYNYPEKIQALILQYVLDLLYQQEEINIYRELKDCATAIKAIISYLEALKKISPVLQSESYKLFSKQTINDYIEHINNLMRIYREEKNPFKKPMMHPFLIAIIIFTLSETHFIEHTPSLLNYFELLHADNNVQLDAEQIATSDAQKLGQHGLYKKAAEGTPLLVSEPNSSSSCCCIIT